MLSFFTVAIERFSVAKQYAASETVYRESFWFRVFCFQVTTKPQQLTNQSSLEPFKLLETQLVCSRRHARQPTRC